MGRILVLPIVLDPDRRFAGFSSRGTLAVHQAQGVLSVVLERPYPDQRLVRQYYQSSSYGPLC